MTVVKELALRWAKAGVKVFPLYGKSPQTILKSWKKEATTDDKIVDQWWQMYPEANYALVTGEKFFVLDWDKKNDPSAQSLKVLETEIDDLWDTYVVKTGGGGYHFYFEIPESMPVPKNSVSEILPGVDVRGVGGLVVGPGSVHPDTGKVYEIQEKNKLKKASEWLIQRLNGGKKEKWVAPEIVPKGERDETLFRQICSWQSMGFSDEKIMEKALEFNASRLTPPKDEQKVRHKVTYVCGKYEKGKQPHFQTHDKEGNPLTSAAFFKRMSIETKRDLVKSIMGVRFLKIHEPEQHFIYKITNIEKKEVRPFSNEIEIKERLLANIEEITGHMPPTRIVTELYYLWLLSGENIKAHPQPFAWADENVWTLKRIDFVPKQGEYPHISQFINRLSSPAEFMAFIWSIFEKKNKSRQFLYLYDPTGQGGKSTFLRVLGSLLGDAVCPISGLALKESSRWLMGSIFNKRLVVWPDCKNPNFGMTEALRCITSGDAVYVEEKGMKPRWAHIYCKLIIGSNYPPQITDTKADVSRLILINVKENEANKNDPGWEKRIKDEMPQFLNDCRTAYEMKCPNDGDIELDETALAICESSITASDELNDLLEDQFEPDPEGFVSSRKITAICREEKIVHKAELFRALEKMGGMRKVKWNATKQRAERGWVGIRTKSEMERRNNIDDL